MADGSNKSVFHDSISRWAARIVGKSLEALAPTTVLEDLGAGIFRPPTARTLVDELVADGYDVWNFNWRASIDFPANKWTLDQAAVYDYPAAVRRIVAETGHDRMKAVVHCQGSTSFFMAAVAGLVPEVTTIVSNAVSLHPVVPAIRQLRGSSSPGSRIFSATT